MGKFAWYQKSPASVFNFQAKQLQTDKDRNWRPFPSSGPHSSRPDLIDPLLASGKATAVSGSVVRKAN